MRTRRPRPVPAPRSAFAGFRFPPDVIVLAVRWYLRFGLSYRDVEELLVERGIEVDHVTINRWVQHFTPLLADAARPCRHAVGGRWLVDETYVKVAGRWRYVYRAIDQVGQVIDIFVSARRDTTAARRFFQQAIKITKVQPVEIITDKAATYPMVLDELVPTAWHRTEQYANNRIEADHSRLKSRLRPMRGLKQDRNARVIVSAMPSSRTFDGGITSWRSRSWRTGGWPSRSMSSPWRSEPRRRSRLRHALAPGNATAPTEPPDLAVQRSPGRRCQSARDTERSSALPVWPTHECCWGNRQILWIAGESMITRRPW
jgi:transposase-like protein